ncbi:hypothetical protein GCM10009119_03610 [Algoriphagus jejuensis]|uniref:Uncharacterized protein n=1 Tax=Algoriphagus jejuensis TaxID=419934 RepID=A0ABN1MVH0_9BACT
MVQQPTTPEEPEEESMFDILERLTKEQESMVFEPPTILTDFFDDDIMCGS